MPIIFKRALRFVAGVATLVAGMSAALAGDVASIGPVDFSDPAFAPVSGSTTIPIGHAQFCKSHRGECGTNVHLTEIVQLTKALWEQLVDVNNEMNTDIAPITDEDLYHVGELWTYPDGYGDCEDIALAKRRALIDDGWDASTLLMTVVREKSGAGHAVLMVRTDRGDLVLDNQEGSIKVWNETPYQFVKRQSQANAGQWVSIDDARSVVTTVASTK
jgi:predicted transglutaminase-like cysteine proteinase